MQQTNQLMSIQYDNTVLKFESLILFKYFLIISKQSEFKEKCNNIKDLIVKRFKKYYDKHNIENLSGDELENHILKFNDEICIYLHDELEDLFQYTIENSYTINNQAKPINIYIEDFIPEIIKIYFLKSLNIRNKFFGLD